MNAQTIIALCILVFLLGMGIMGLIMTSVRTREERKRNRHEHAVLDAGDILELQTDNPFIEVIQIVIVDKKQSETTGETWCKYVYLDKGKLPETPVFHADVESKMTRMWKKVGFIDSKNLFNYVK